MTNSRTVLLLLIALVTALAAALTARHLLTNVQQTSPGSPVASVETVPVVVAINRIPMLSSVKANDVKVIQFPRGQLPFDPSLPAGGYSYVSQVPEVVGKFVTQTIYPGEPLVRQRLRDNLGASPLAHVVANSQRAVAIRINDVTGVGGFLKHGDRVDILLTHRPPDSGSLRTDLIAQAVKVLAIDQDPSEDRDKPVVARTVTLELCPQEAQEIVRAMETGTIQLTLRNPLEAPPVARDNCAAVRLLPVSARTGGTAKASGVPRPPGVIRTLVLGRKVVTLRCTNAGCQEENPAVAPPGSDASPPGAVPVNASETDPANEDSP